METRISALIFADIAGYTVLIENDPIGTTARVNHVINSFVWEFLSEYGCRLVQLEGDGFFLEAKCSYDALRFAVSLQTEMKKYNASFEKSDRLEFRIGIHKGEVVVDTQTNRLSGHAVNLASRLESVSEQNGIFVSEDVARELSDHSEYEIVSLGSRRLKNISGKTAVYGVLIPGISNEYTVLREHESKFRTVTPTIAILPFKVYGNSTDYNYIGDALVEDLLTAFDRYPELSIVLIEQTNVSSLEKNAAKTIGRKYDADYLILGGIVVNNDAVRVNTRLIESEYGTQIWSEKFDSPVLDLFDLYDRITSNLVTKLPVELERSTLNQVGKKYDKSLDAYDYYIKGRELYREKTAGSDKTSAKYLKKAISLDPRLADAHAILGAIYGINWAYESWGTNPTQKILDGRTFIQKAIHLDPNSPRAYAHLAWTYLSTREFDEASKYFDIALSLNPYDVDVQLLKAYGIMYMGKADESIRICNYLLEKNPHHPEWYIDVLGGAYFIERDYEKALPLLIRVRELFPECEAWIAACHAYMGHHTEARKCSENFISNIDKIWRGSPCSNKSHEYTDWLLRYACPFRHASDHNHMLEGLIASGLNSITNTIDECSKQANTLESIEIDSNNSKLH